MKNTNKLALALTLAFASLGAQAQNMDIGIGGASRPAPTTAAPATSASPANNLQALNPAPAAPAATSAKADVVAAKVVPAAPIASPAPVAKKPAAPAITVAQAPVQSAPVPVAPRATPAPAAAPASVAPSKQNGLENETNPFTGKDLSAEQRQRQLENAKMDTDLIQEKLKQANLIADLTYLPLKKKAEVSTLPGVAKDLTAAAPAKPTAETGAQPARKPVKKGKATKKTEEKTVSAPSAPVQPSITVSSISINGSKASAILEAEGGGVMSAQHGDITPFGQLRVINGSTISLGGRTLTVRDAMLSRMVVSDPVVVDPEKARMMPVALSAAPASTPSAAPNTSIPLPPLPPLPAPPKGMVSMAPTPSR